jgi:hypothetical protein
MTDKIDVAGLRALVAKATPGPWRVEQMHTSAHIHQQDGLHWLASCVVGHGDWHNPEASRGAKDAALITAAVNALPALLDAAEATAALEGEVRKRLDSAKAWRAGTDEGTPDWYRFDGAARECEAILAARAALSELPQ